MRIGVVGATGFIGGAVVRELARRRHEVTAFVRSRERAAAIIADPGVDLVDDGWCHRLSGLDGLVIAIGAIGGSGMVEAHRDLPARLAEAARAAGVPRLVHLSAVGASRDAPTPFLRSKAEGEAAVLSRRLPGWTILRPSLVYGPGGASMNLFATLAALPVRPSLKSGPIRPLAVDDLARAIADLVEQDVELPPGLDAVGPERTTIDGYVAELGRWLGTEPLLTALLPRPLLSLAAKISSVLGVDLVTPDTLTMLDRGADGDPGPLRTLTRVRPSGLRAGLARHPATRAEKIAAATGPWPVVLQYALATLWIGSGLASLMNMEAGYSLLAHGGIDGPTATALILAGGLWDLALGTAILHRRFVRSVAALQAGTILLYTVLATLIVPQAWMDPLGQLLKNIPVLAATLYLASIGRR